MIERIPLVAIHGAGLCMHPSGRDPAAAAAVYKPQSWARGRSRGGLAVATDRVV